MHLTYFWLDIGTLLFPLLLSFDRKVAFWKSWKYLFPAMFTVALFFLVWDYFFTVWGVWGFTHKYLLGIFAGPLPLEEIAFFLVVPYACVFVYECLRIYFPADPFRRVYPWLNWLFLLLCLLALGFYHDRLYTSVTALFLAGTLAAHIFIFKSRYMGYFYLAWIICIVPMLIVNGVLTSLPVVWYNDTQNIGFRVGTIPFEDFFYNMLCMLMNVGIFEMLRRRKQKSVSLPAEPASA
jgi:lycopene cyclase domain-containing protein